MSSSATHRAAHGGTLQLALLLVPLALVPWGAGCQQGQVASHNLDEVLSPEGRLRYAGDLRTAREQLLLGLVPPGFQTEDGAFGLSAEGPIPDPTDVVVENLLRLAEAEDGSPRWRDATRVRHFARYAVECPAGLGRERALLELATEGRRLELSEPWQAPTAPAGPEELRARLDGLVEAASALVTAGTQADATAVLDFRAQCELISDAEVDLQGARRLLQAVAPLFELRLPDEASAAVEALSLALQKRVVAEALARGLRDPLPYVRAAAVRANCATFGDPFLLEAALVLGARPIQPALPRGIGAGFERFGLASEPFEEWQVRATVCELLVDRGLPAAAGVPDMQGLGLKLGLLQALMTVATRYDAFHPRARTQAMRALAVVSGARESSLREEVWVRWWRAVRPELEAAFDRAVRDADATRGAVSLALKNGP